jgi:predicted kinase
MEPGVQVVEIDAEALQTSLEKRLRARAARADSAVELTAETLQRWVQEELRSLLEELAVVQELAGGNSLN